MNFSKNLKYLMSEKNINQLTLANIAGVSQRTISSWLNAQNEPSAFSIIKIADYFGVSVDYLLGRVDDFGDVISSTVDPLNLLPLEERELLVNFRKLVPSMREYMLTNVKLLAAQNG